MAEPKKLGSPVDDQLGSWAELNGHLRGCNDPEELLPLLREAVKRETRYEVVIRIYQRYSKLRRDREQKELRAGTLPKELENG